MSQKLVRVHLGENTNPSGHFGAVHQKLVSDVTHIELHAALNRGSNIRNQNGFSGTVVRTEEAHQSIRQNQKEAIVMSCSYT
jgi:preprotein translocase subunit YajC